jgi:hypothetical protein
MAGLCYQIVGGRYIGVYDLNAVTIAVLSLCISHSLSGEYMKG